MFDLCRPERDTSQRLMTLTQAYRSVMDYAIDFHIFAADRKLNEPAIFDAFYHGLLNPVTDKLAGCDLPKDLNREDRLSHSGGSADTREKPGAKKIHKSSSVHGQLATCLTTDQFSDLSRRLQVLPLDHLSQCRLGGLN